VNTPEEVRSWWSIVRASLRGEAHDYTSGSLTRAIWLLAIPMVLEMTMESTFAIVDVFFVSRLGDEAVAAVGVTESMLTIVYAFGIGLAMATTALVARRIGERNVDGAVRGATAAIALGVGIGLVLGLPCLAFAPELLRLMGTEPAVVETGAGYTRAVLGGNLVVLLLYLNNAIFRGAGDPALAMRVLAIANGINVVLDPCLIFGLGPFPELGVTGAGIATLVGRGAGVGYQLWMLRRGAGRIALRGPAARIERPIVAELVRLSLGGVAQLLIATASWVALMRIVAPFGKEALAGYTIAIRIVVFALMPAWGLGNAAATLVGQNLGAERPERAERSVWLTGLYNMAFMGAVTVVFLACAPALVRIFTEKPETHALGVSALRILAYGYVFYAWGMVIAQAFNGAGDTLTPTRLNFLCFWCFQIPLAWTLARPLELGPPGVFWAVCVSESVLAVSAMLLFRRGRWKEAKIAADTGARAEAGVTAAASGATGAAGPSPFPPDRGGLP
jgi:putative MATE family efflux protein